MSGVRVVQFVAVVHNAAMRLTWHMQGKISAQCKSAVSVILKNVHLIHALILFESRKLVQIGVTAATSLIATLQSSVQEHQMSLCRTKDFASTIGTNIAERLTRLIPHANTQPSLETPIQIRSAFL
jgi:hypothetical protein